MLTFCSRILTLSIALLDGSVSDGDASSWVPKTRKQVTKIWERIYLGNLKDAEQLARSNPQRITTVVSLCREHPAHRSPKITYIHIPIPDSRPISAQKFEDIMFAMAIGVPARKPTGALPGGHESVANPDCCMARSLWLRGNRQSTIPDRGAKGSRSLSRIAPKRKGPAEQMKRYRRNCEEESSHSNWHIIGLHASRSRARRLSVMAFRQNLYAKDASQA